jgi:hypothetical protein
LGRNGCGKSKKREQKNNSHGLNSFLATINFRKRF